ncbi:MAG: hypothetical protein Q9178_007997 [Gyalolechia marmorata]
MFAAAVTSIPTTNTKRGSTTATVVFRSDLKAGEGQSDQFKDLLLSTVANNNTAGGYDITFVNKCEKNLASGAVVKSKGIPLTTNTTGTVSTLYMNVGTTSDQRVPQPVTLGAMQQSLGFLYETGGELKLGSTMPQWDTWLICDGTTTTHPELRWVGVVQGVVLIPKDCSAVRLMAMNYDELEKNVEGQC